MIDGDGVLAIGAAVTMLTGVTKSVLPADRASQFAPYVALAISLVATAIYVLSLPVLPGRTDAFGLLVAWLSVFGTATGLYKVGKLTRVVG